MQTNGSSIVPSTALLEPESATSSGVRHSDLDWMPRQRDNRGNACSRSYLWECPHVGLPLDHSRLQPLLERIDPLAASYVAWRYELLYLTYQRYQRLQEEVVEQFHARQQRNQQRNCEIDQQIEQLRQDKDQACAGLQQQRELLEDELGQTQIQAAQAVSTAGADYHPDQPENAKLLATEQVNLKPYLARLSLPDPSDDEKALLPNLVGYIGTLLVGSLLGISVGLMAGFVNPATLTRRLLPTIVCALLGLGPALFMRKSLNGAFRLASESAYLGKSLLGRLPSKVVGILLLLAFILVDCAVEYHGLLKLAKLDAGLTGLSGKTAANPLNNLSNLGYYAVACVVTMGYLCYSAYEGWFSGRRHVILNQAFQLQQNDQSERHHQHHQRPEVRKALESVATVREASRRRGLLEQRLQTLEKYYDQRIADLERQRRELLDEPSLEDKQRVQDAHDNLKGAQQEFDKLLSSLIILKETWWQRLGKRLFGS